MPITYLNNSSFDYIDPIDPYSKSLNINPNNPEYWFDIGLVKYRLKLYNNSIDAFNRSLNMSPNNPESWFYMGLAKYRQQKYPDSIDAFNKSLIINNNSTEAWYFRGLARFYQDDYAGSIDDFSRSIDLNSKNAETWYFRGLARYYQYDLNGSIDDLNKSLSIMSKGQKAWDHKGLSIYNESIPSDSNDSNIEPMNARALYYKESAYYLQGYKLLLLGKYNDAITAYDKGIKANPNLIDAIYNKGYALIKEGNFEEAISAYDKVIIINNEGKINITKKAWNNKAYSLLQLNRSSEAYVAFAKGMDLDNSKKFKYISLLFFVTYLILSIIGYSISRKVVISTEVLAFFSNLLGFLILAWFFSELYDFESSILIFIYVFLVIGVTLIFLVSIGLPIVDLWQRLITAFSISKRNMYLYNVINTKLCLFAIVIYLILACIFSLRLVDSEPGMLLFLKATLIFIPILNLSVTLPHIVNLLLSVRVDHDTRNILLILQFGYLCLSALLLSTVLWIFGISQNALSISPFFLGIMILLMVLLFLFPYFSGWQREKRWHELLLRMRLESIDELLDIFEFPNPSQYVPKLQRLSHQIEDRMKLINDNETGASNVIDKDGSKKHETIYEKQFRKNEPYNSYQDFQRQIHENIQESINQLKTHSDENELLKIGEAYAKLYHQRKKDISEMIEQEKKSRPLLWIGLTFGLTSITAGVLAFITNWLETTLKNLVL